MGFYCREFMLLTRWGDMCSFFKKKPHSTLYTHSVPHNILYEIKIRNAILSAVKQYMIFSPCFFLYTALKRHSLYSNPFNTVNYTNSYSHSAGSPYSTSFSSSSPTPAKAPLVKQLIYPNNSGKSLRSKRHMIDTKKNVFALNIFFYFRRLNLFLLLQFMQIKHYISNF